MKISALRLFNVRRFGGRGVAIEGIGDGVNVLSATNEFGKSTSFEALHALFFQPHSGTPGDVQRLRPYSGGNPLIEADIVTADGRFRITKQYYGGRSARVVDIDTGRLVAQADEAENFIAGLVRGGTAGPAGLLWVRQGITGIERRSRSDEESESRVRQSLLESVQGEVEAITGGRRMKAIMAATAEALAELVTPTGRPKAGGRYAAAIDARDRLVAEETKLGAEVTALRKALDERTKVQRQLAELDSADDRAERRRSIDRAQAAFDAARAQGDALKAAEAELRLARERRNGAERDLAAFRSALAAATELQRKLADSRQRRQEALDHRAAAAGAAAKAEDAVTATESAEREARELLARLDAALRAREAAERLADLEQRLASAEEARLAIEKSEAALAPVKIAAESIDALQKLEIDIVRLQAVEQAARPTVSVAYEAGATVLVSVDGVPLPAGEERGHDGRAILSVPGIGTITLRSNRPAQGNGQLAQAEEKRRALLASLGVADLAEARTRQMTAQRLDADLREARQRLALLAPDGLPSLRADIAARRATAGEGAQQPEQDPAQAKAALAEAERKRAEARQSLREAEPRRIRADEAYVTAETAIAAIGGEMAQVDAALGQMEGRTARESALFEAVGAAGRQFALAEAQAERLRATAADLASAEAALTRARSVHEAAEKEIARLRETIAGLNAEIRSRSDEAVEEKWRETVDALASATTRADAFAREVAVLQRLASALETARAGASELYLKPVIAELRPLLGLLFDDISISFDEKTLLPQAIVRNGQEEDVERLSGGMREQLSVLTRLAFARLLAKDGRPAPVILDDALVYSDDDRIERMFDALHRQSRDQQIIVFSCRQRAFQKLGGNVLRMTDWQPQG